MYIIKIRAIRNGKAIGRIRYLSSHLAALKHKNFRALLFFIRMASTDIESAKKFKSKESAEKEVKRINRIYARHLMPDILEVDNR